MYNFGQPIDLVGQQQSRARVHMLGVNTFGQGIDLIGYQRGRAKVWLDFPGRMPAHLGSSGKPWYEAFFAHMENMAPVMSSFALQLYSMYGQQRQQYWQRADTQQREMAYMDMMKSMVAQKTTGKGTMDPNTQAFLFQQMQSEDPAYRQMLINQASGGNATISAQLNAMLSGGLSGNMGTLIIYGGLAIGGFFLIKALMKKS